VRIFPPEMMVDKRVDYITSCMYLTGIEEAFWSYMLGLVPLNVVRELSMKTIVHSCLFHLPSVYETFCLASNMQMMIPSGISNSLGISERHFCVHLREIHMCLWMLRLLGSVPCLSVVASFQRVLLWKREGAISLGPKFSGCGGSLTSVGFGNPIE